MEEAITFSAGSIVLEGLVNQRAGAIGAIIAHPHPLYGGDMYNPVIECLADVLYHKGYTTLRFNFRGVGRSGGSHGGGRAEGEDVLAAVSYLKDQGVSTILAAGYSFGAWVLAHIETMPAAVQGMLFVAPPLALMPFVGKRHLPRLQLVITGEEDEIAAPHLIRRAIGEWNPEAVLAVIDDADHFYFGRFQALAETLHDQLTRPTGF